MASGIDKLAKQIASIIKKDEQTKGYDTTATVTRIDGGTAWVHIPGGVDETPVKMTVNAKAGDSVQVRVSGGRAFLVGNGTAPPTDDSGARALHELSSRAIKAVYGVADKAAKIAGNTAQYFWTTEEGTDTGAHITEKPKEDFLTDPENGGANLLLRSIGIAIRQGLVELASFSASGLHINSYDGNGNEITIAHLGYGSGKAWDGSTSDAPYYDLGRRATGSTIGNYSVVEGTGCTASGFSAHAEGGQNTASGNASHAEGNQTNATKQCAHAEGYLSTAGGQNAHAEGVYTTASGDNSHAGGENTKASMKAQRVIGTYNVEDTQPSTAVHPNGSTSYGHYAFIIGNGRDASNRSNAFTVDWVGRTTALSFSNTSDIRLKKNVEDCNVNALDAINKIRMRQFDWLNTDEHERIGVIADELEKIDPAFASGGGYNRDGSINVKTVNQTYLVHYLIKAIQELSDEVDRLKGVRK